MCAVSTAVLFDNIRQCNIFGHVLIIYHLDPEEASPLRRMRTWPGHAPVDSSERNAQILLPSQMLYFRIQPHNLQPFKIKTTVESYVNCNESTRKMKNEMLLLKLIFLPRLEDTRGTILSLLVPQFWSMNIS